MAGAFATHTSGQMSGCPAAILVMSRNPPAASRSSASCSSATRSARFMSVAAVRCGTCDTVATSVSCCSGDSATTSAPRLVTTARTWAKASGSVSPVGVRTQVAPTNRSGSAPSIPTCSDPAMGWPPTNRGWGSRAARGAFTPATSVTMASRRRARASAALTSSTTATTGVATKVISASGSIPDLVEGAEGLGPIRVDRVDVGAGDPPSPSAQGEPDRPTDQPRADDGGAPGVTRGGHRAAPGPRGGRRGGGRGGAARS